MDPVITTHLVIAYLAALVLGYLAGRRGVKEAEAASVAWREDAQQEMRNADYYRSLLDRCAKAIGDRAYTQDDGNVIEDPLRAKIPEIIEEDYEAADRELACEGVFAGHHGIEGLADCDEFWEAQPYGTRLLLRKRDRRLHAIQRAQRMRREAEGTPASPCSPNVLEKLAALKKAIRFVQHDLEDAHYIRATHSIEGVKLSFSELEEAIFQANE